MINKFRSSLNFGNVNQTNNIVIANSTIDTSIKRLEQDFHEGNIKQALNDLESFLIENKISPKIRYQLYVKKASFFFSLRRYDEALDLLDYIKKEYRTFLETGFDELQLISFCIGKDRKNFFELVDKIKIENSESPNIENFELMYYFHTGDILKAKEIFERIDNKLKKEKDIVLMGGHIYSSLDDYENTNKFYKLALSFDISYLDKATIYGFYGTYIINKSMHGQSISEDYIKTICIYKDIIKHILEQSSFFNKLYIINLKNIFLHLFIIDNNIKGYIDFYEKEFINTSIVSYHYFQYTSFKKGVIEDKKIQEIILKGDEEILLHYVHILEEDNGSHLKIIIFLEENKELIYSSQFIFVSYVKWKIKNNSDLDNEFIDYLISHKYKEFDYLIVYLLFLKSSSTPLAQEDISKLLKFAHNEKVIYARILETLFILKDLGKRSEYLNLALEKEEEFKYIISETLKLCYDDKNLLIDDFSYFIDNMSNQTLYYSHISNIYFKYANYKLSFDFLFKDYKRNSENNSILLDILRISINHFIKTKNVYEKDKQLEVYSLLISRKDNLVISDIVFLLQYSIMILKDTKQILPFLNQYLLSTNINELEEEIKINFSDLYTKTSFGIANYNDLFLYDDNICLVGKGKIYIKNQYKILEENQDNLEFVLLDDNEFFLMAQNDIVSEESLLHRIIGTFTFRINNPNHIQMKIDTKSDNPLSELLLFVEEQNKQTISLYERYSNKEYCGLFALAEYDYKNYFTCIPYLLNHKKYYFNSLKRNFIVDRKKILTLSTIVFLHEIAYLEEVLQREDIVIQQTLINWMREYIDKFNYSRRPQDYSYLDNSEPVFIPYTEEEDKEAEDFKQFIVSLTTKLLKCEIIDDTLSNLPLGEAYEILADSMGSQEYHALAYCVENNYQIISENNIFEFMFSSFSYNKMFIGNSLGLLEDILDNKQMHILEKELYKKQYRYIFSCLEEDKLIEMLSYEKLEIILNEQMIFKFRIWYEYGCLDNIITKYIHSYKVLYPKKYLPVENTFSKNMKHILQLIDVYDDIFNEKIE